MTLNEYTEWFIIMKTYILFFKQDLTDVMMLASLLVLTARRILDGPVAVALRSLINPDSLINFFIYYF